MDKYGILLIAILIFIAFTVLLMVLGGRYYKKEYGTKNWTNWTSRLYNLQAAVFYSLILTTITIFLLKWAKILDF